MNELFLYPSVSLAISGALVYGLVHRAQHWRLVRNRSNHTVLLTMNLAP